CATANLSKLLVVLLDEALADDALGKFALVDPDVEVLVDGTTDVAAGGYLIAQNGEVDLVAIGTTPGVRAVAQAWDAHADNEVALVRCGFNGLYGMGFVYAAS